MSTYLATVCTCPEFDEEYDGPSDHADACRDCPKHGTAIG